ncbi:hypothetical protein FSP39_018966 [Pinctada imbricata]|uniref:SGNH hydrolase-type esterase domain-containing protein n=1 Tax=Pinctada imbricata TaxID=66713 RepID=A0AA88YE68_PINIB|nr:hypothetical protein FSP39_018966 [Pinctada imbricata]
MAEKVLVLGSSHINHLKTFVRQRGCTDFNFHPPIHVHLFGISGGRLQASSHVRLLKNEIRAVKPNALVIHIGGNDLDRKNVTEDCVQTLCYQLVSLCAMLIRRFNLRKITILQLMPRVRTRHVPVHSYNNLVIAFNKELKRAVSAHPKIKYWTISGIKQTKQQIFSDEVHLNNLGLVKYYKNVRGAIINSMKMP